MQFIQRWCLRLTIIISISLVLSTTSIALADQVEQMQTELDTIKQRLQQQLERVKSGRSEVGSAAAQLTVVEHELSKRQSELRSVENQLVATQHQIEQNSSLLEATELELGERQQLLRQRMRDIYINGRVNYLDILLGSVNFTDFTTRYDLLQRILHSDTQLIAKAEADLELIAATKAKLEQDVLVLANLQQQALEQRALVASRYRDKRAILTDLQSNQHEAELAYQQLQQASYQIEQMLKRRNNGGIMPSGIATGQYLWPTNGVITSNFGWRTHPVFGNKRLHAGMDIGADYGEPVAAADGGRVVSAGWISGYGKTVIIEHNNAYSTLYAHNSELLVSGGELVSQGQLIARVGDTGYTTGPNLHFEVRLNGSPTDPREYLP